MILKNAAGWTLFLALVMWCQTGRTKTITLSDALERAVHQTSRGGVIQGDLEVAEQSYRARRLTFYVPSLSIQGSLPSYAVEESYRFFYGSNQKSLYKTNDFGLSSFVQLKQALLTGGDFTARANLTAAESEYPNTLRPGQFYDERNRHGFFEFSLEQPLLKPSTSKNELYDRRDEYHIAEMVRVEAAAGLRKEVIEAYVGTLQMALKRELAEVRLQKARAQAAVDSSKLADGVVSEDKWLETASGRLDAELNSYDAQSQFSEKHRQLATLLDMEVADSLEVVTPEVQSHPQESQLRQRVESWEQSISMRKAELAFRKADRAANFAARSHGLSGSLAASYSFGRGKVRITGEDDDNIRTNSWNVALNFSFPIWDGGASGASVKAARLAAERSRLEYLKVQKASRSEIEALVNKLQISYRKLTVLRQQVDLAERKMGISEERWKNGEISEIAYLESKDFLLEARDKYLTELKNYYLSKVELDGKFPS